MADRVREVGISKVSITEVVAFKPPRTVSPLAKVEEAVTSIPPLRVRMPVAVSLASDLRKEVDSSKSKVPVQFPEVSSAPQE